MLREIEASKTPRQQRAEQIAAEYWNPGNRYANPAPWERQPPIPTEQAQPWGAAPEGLSYNAPIPLGVARPEARREMPQQPEYTFLQEQPGGAAPEGLSYNAPRAPLGVARPEAEREMPQQQGQEQPNREVKVTIHDRPDKYYILQQNELEPFVKICVQQLRGKQNFESQAILVELGKNEAEQKKNVSSLKLGAEKTGHSDESRPEAPSSPDDQRPQATLPQNIEKIQKSVIIREGDIETFKSILSREATGSEYGELYGKIRSKFQGVVEKN